MVEKSTKPFGGFDELVDMITRVEKPAEEKEEAVVEEVDDEEEAKESTEGESKIPEPPVKDPKKPVKPIEEEEESEESEEEESEEEPTNLGEVEPEISSYFADKLIEKLGVELTDKTVKFEKLDDVIDLMTEVIQNNSKPEFASPEVEEYNTYVKSGGNLKTFYDTVYTSGIDPDKVDIESEKDQKAVIEANLKNLGYKEDRIKKVIDRYTDAEVLKDEAVDALESLKEFQTKTAKTLLANQEKERLNDEKRNKEFFDDVIKYVNNLKDIRGVEVDSKTKKEIVDYIFRVTPEGTTQFQKAYASDVVKNLIESAYFTKYGDTLLSKTSKKATDAALNKVRDKLKASKGKRNTGSGSGLGKTSPNFSALSGLIIK
jgi:hypothetical protein